MSVPMTLSDLERRDVRALLADLLNNILTSPRTTNFDRITDVRKKE